MPRRFEDLKWQSIPSKNLTRFERIDSISLFEKSDYRDKCSRGFSEFQYFTKEILFFKPELVVHFLILTRFSASLTEMCKSRGRPNPMRMNKLSENEFQRHIASCQLALNGHTSVGSHSNFLEITALTTKVSLLIRPAFRPAQNDASGMSCQVDATLS